MRTRAVVGSGEALRIQIGCDGGCWQVLDGAVAAVAQLTQLSEVFFICCVKDDQGQANATRALQNAGLVHPKAPAVRHAHEVDAVLARAAVVVDTWPRSVERGQPGACGAGGWHGDYAASQSVLQHERGMQGDGPPAGAGPTRGLRRTEVGFTHLHTHAPAPAICVC